MSFKSLILLEMVGNFANFHVRYSQFYPSHWPIILSRDWRHGRTLMMKFLLRVREQGLVWAGEGGGGGRVFPTE